MFNLQSGTVSVNGTAVTIADILRSLHLRRRLVPLLREVAAESLVLSGAGQAGLAVSDDDLQQAADSFRRRQGLVKAEQMQKWLAREGLTLDDFEASLERDLLFARFRQHWTEPRLADHFKAHRDRYARAHLRQIVVASEGLARELLAEINDDGQDFADLARKHSLHGPSRLAGGSVGVVGRHALPRPLGDAVFAARPGQVVGPLPGPDGFRVVLVEDLLPPELDAETQAVVRSELFDGWLRDQLRDIRIDLSCIGIA